MAKAMVSLCAQYANSMANLLSLTDIMRMFRSVSSIYHDFLQTIRPQLKQRIDLTSESK